jgi:HAD superfamily hydrolase (TIGR01509 family)|tara:strand:+ start:13049 stop:13723 length:675 start_codon:yes stop_codon:yes gene_type:complete
VKKAIIFDFDGVILDTETPDYESWADLFEAYNVQLDLEVWSPLIGGDVAFSVYQHLEDLTGIAFDRPKLRKTRHATYVRMVESNPVLPGVLEYLESAARLNLSLAVASSSNGGWAQSHLERLGLIDFFSAVRTADDVARAKPHPDVYLAALDALGVAPADAIAIEDSPTGIAAAKRAGIFCVVVPNPMTRNLPVEEADIRLESLADLSLDGLMRQVASTEATGA